MIEKRYKGLLLLLFFIALTVSSCGQRVSKGDSTAIADAAWRCDTVDGLILHRHHFSRKNCMGANQFVCVLEVPPQSPYRLAFTYEPTRTPTSVQARKHYAVAAVNGSYFDMRYHNPICYLRIDGKELGINTPQESDSIHRKYYQYGSLALKDGRPLIFVPDSARMAERTLPYSDIMTAGPLLMLNGEVMPMRDDKTFVTDRHNRTAIGIKDDGTVLLVTVDGRTKDSQGMSLTEFTTLLRVLGCRDALNLDGGGSSTMYMKDYPNQGVVNHPSDNGRYDFEGERGVSNCIVVVMSDE